MGRYQQHYDYFCSKVTAIMAAASRIEANVAVEQINIIILTIRAILGDISQNFTTYIRKTRTNNFGELVKTTAANEDVAHKWSKKSKRDAVCGRK